MLLALFIASALLLFPPLRRSFLHPGALFPLLRCSLLRPGIVVLALSSASAWILRRCGALTAIQLAASLPARGSPIHTRHSSPVNAPQPQLSGRYHDSCTVRSAPGLPRFVSHGSTRSSCAPCSSHAFVLEDTLRRPGCVLALTCSSAQVVLSLLSRDLAPQPCLLLRLRFRAQISRWCVSCAHALYSCA